MSDRHAFRTPLRRFLTGFCIVLCLAAGGFLATAATASEPAARAVAVNAQTDVLDLGDSMGLLVDRSRALDIDAIAALGPESFEPLAERGNALGFIDASIWLHQRLRVVPGAPPTLWLSVEDATLDLLTLYTPSAEGYVAEFSGDKRPFAERRVDHRLPVFRVVLPAEGFVDIYLRIDSAGSIQIVPKLWSSAALMAHIDFEQLLYGAYYGLMIVLAMASIYAWLLLREQVFLRYAVYLGSFLMFQLAVNGVAFQYLWGGFPELSTQLNATAVGSVTVSALWFSSGFLKLDEYSPKSAALFRGLMIFMFACLLFAWLSDTHLALQLLVAGSMSLVPAFMIAAYHVLRLGYKPARYFSAAWAVLMSGVMLAGLRYQGLLPANFLTLYALPISSTLEIVILAMALVDRFMALYEAKSRAERVAQSAVEQLNHELNLLVAERTRELERSNSLLRELAEQDSMTGLYNHRAIVQALDRELAGARRHHYPVAAVMIDIDHFKQINDRWGHPIGDGVLRKVAGVLTANLRESDACGRYGGEEFLLILTHETLSEVHAASERIRHHIAALRFDEMPDTRITASLGVAICEPGERGSYTASSLIAAADRALYDAKSAGRDAVRVAACG